MNQASFEGLLTDYALGEIDDLETKALLEALLERDESLRVSLAEIRSTTELIVLADSEWLVGHAVSKPRSFFDRHARLIVSAGMVAALVGMSLILWWPTLPPPQDDRDLVESHADGAHARSEVEPGSAAADVVGGSQRLQSMVAAVEERTPRPNRRGAGIRWSALVSSRSDARQ